MPVERVISAILQMSSVFLCSVVLVFTFITGKYKSKLDWSYFRLICCNMAAILLDFLALIYRYQTTSIAFFAVRVTNFLAFFFNLLMTVLFYDYVSSYIAEKVNISKTPNKVVKTVTAFSIFLLTLNIFYPIIYYFDPQYERTGLFWIIEIPGVLSLILGFILILRHRKKLKPYELLAMLMYTSLPILAILVQFVFYGIAFTSLANTLAIAVVFIFLQSEREKELAQAEKDILANQINISISQIQPHFLNNALNTIQYLCNTDPELASDTVGKFSKYMRMNLDSITQKEPIAFDLDFEHLENYLSIEKLRFPDIEFIYDIKVRDFKLPPLTLQPIVENAIKHGVRSLEEEKKITVSTFEDGKNVYVTVEDNGIGFDTNAVFSDKKSHIGIKNTTHRLSVMCSGRLDIDSSPGKGTMVTITVPKLKSGKESINENISG